MVHSGSMELWQVVDNGGTLSLSLPGQYHPSNWFSQAKL